MELIAETYYALKNLLALKNEQMADRLEQLIEMECADALLDSGVSVPLKRWKLPWLKRPVEVRVTARWHKL